MRKVNLSILSSGTQWSGLPKVNGSIQNITIQLISRTPKYKFWSVSIFGDQINMEDQVFSVLWFCAYIALLLSVLHKYFTWHFDYFWEQGISGPRPVPVFGNCWNIWKQNTPLVEIQRYQKFGTIYGIFEGRKPNLVIGNPKLIRKILIDDFEHFENRRKSPGNSHIKFLLPTLTGQKWNRIRQGTETIYSSRSIRNMTSLIESIAQEMVEFLQRKVDDGLKKIELRNLATTYAIDIVANCSFGFKLNTFTNSEAQTSQFYQELTTIFGRTKPITPAFTIGQLYRVVGKLMPRPSGFEFFATFATDILKARRQRNLTIVDAEKRCDFVDELLEASKTANLNDDNVLVDQMLQFLVAGVEPVAIAIACCINSLAVNLEIQNKLREEINTTFNKGQFRMELDLDNMTYLDQCVDETLRMFPPALRLERRCNRSIAYEKAKCQKGTIVSIPIYAIHHDPNIYPQPEVFDPNRFSPTEKSKRDPMLFLPFGDGRRSCIGSNFAKTQIKIALIHLIHDFEFFRIFETSDIPECVPTSFPPTLNPPKIIVGIRKP